MTPIEVRAALVCENHLVKFRFKADIEYQVLNPGMGKGCSQQWIPANNMPE